MSASAGTSGTSGAGGMMSGGIMNMVQNWLTGGQPGGTALGQTTPEWDFPYGMDRIPDDLRSAFFRADAGPTGFNEFLQQMKVSNPGLVDRFRSYVNMGIIRPKNQAAQQVVMSNGGYQAGDMTPLGPMINGMPSGLNEQQLGVLANVIGSGIQYNLGLIEASGYLDGMPTLDRENIIGQLAQGWMEQATAQFTAKEAERSNMAQEGLSQQEITNQNIQSMAEIFGGMAQTDPATGQTSFQPTEQARQFNTEQSGWLNGDATLTREQQAFNQAKDVANLASNPRNYIEAQMLQNARGGLTGMAPNNQVQQTTFGPATTTQQPQFMAPGGKYNQLPTLQTMQGQVFDPNDISMMMESGQGGQGSAPGASPQAQSATGQYNLSNPATWQQMGAQAGQQWGTAQQGLQNIQDTQGFQGLRPAAGTYQGPGPAAPTWFGQPQAGQDGRTSISPVNPATGLRFDENTGQYTSAPLPTAQENYARRGALMGGLEEPLPFAPPTGDGVQPAGQATPTQYGPLSSLTQLRAGGQSPAQRLAASRQPNQMAFNNASPMAAFNRGQDVAGANQGAKYATSNFTQSLLQNRVVPRSGGLNVAGKYMSAQEMANGVNPNKIRTQDYLRGDPSQQQGFQAVGSMAGYSGEDLQSIMQKNLPSFKAPGAGRMI